LAEELLQALAEEELEEAGIAMLAEGMEETLLALEEQAALLMVHALEELEEQAAAEQAGNQVEE
jgi:hypothetical protein